MYPPCTYTQLLWWLPSTEVFAYIFWVFPFLHNKQLAQKFSCAWDQLFSQSHFPYMFRCWITYIISEPSIHWHWFLPSLSHSCCLYFIEGVTTWSCIMFQEFISREQSISWIIPYEFGKYFKNKMLLSIQNAFA